ncbi:hypothetical protein JCM11491_003695 [Sporobolomyces phaffii]
MELRLSTDCSACGARVSLDVPKWISDAVQLAQTTPDYHDRCHQDDRNETGGETARALRSLVVAGAVNFAVAVKTSPVLPIVFAALQTFAAFLVYLDAQFALRERATLAATEVAMGIVEIEKELGVLRNAGEGLSIAWEALVKGVIGEHRPYE